MIHKRPPPPPTAMPMIVVRGMLDEDLVEEPKELDELESLCSEPAAVTTSVVVATGPKFGRRV